MESKPLHRRDRNANFISISPSSFRACLRRLSHIVSDFLPGDSKLRAIAKDAYSAYSEVTQTIMSEKSPSSILHFRSSLILRTKTVHNYAASEEQSFLHGYHCSVSLHHAMHGIDPVVSCAQLRKICWRDMHVRKVPPPDLAGVLKSVLE